MTNSQIRENLLKNIRGDRIPNAICIIDSGGRGSLQLASKLGLSIVDNPNRSVNRSIFVHPDLHYIYPTKKPEKREEKHFNKKMNEGRMSKTKIEIRKTLRMSIIESMV